MLINMPSPTRLLTAREVANVLGISPRSVWRHSAEGLLPSPVHLGRRCSRWPADAIREHIEKLRAAQSA